MITLPGGTLDMLVTAHMIVWLLSSGETMSWLDIWAWLHIMFGEGEGDGEMVVSLLWLWDLYPLLEGLSREHMLAPES